jgi:hypothetical protein
MSYVERGGSKSTVKTYFVLADNGFRRKFIPDPDPGFSTGTRIRNTASNSLKAKRIHGLRRSMLEIGMHRILFLPDIRPAGYPANPKAGYRISG